MIVQLVRFGLVGCRQHGADARHLRRDARACDAPWPSRGAVGLGVGAVNGYLLNRAWTFRGAARGAVPAARYVVVQLMGSALNAALVAIAVGQSTCRDSPASSRCCRR